MSRVRRWRPWGQKFRRPGSPMLKIQSCRSGSRLRRPFHSGPSCPFNLQLHLPKHPPQRCMTLSPLSTSVQGPSPEFQVPSSAPTSYQQQQRQGRGRGRRGEQGRRRPRYISHRHVNRRKAKELWVNISIIIPWIHASTVDMVRDFDTLVKHALMPATSPTAKKGVIAQNRQDIWCVWKN